MPEGDTIFRAAATLKRAIEGKVVQRFYSPLPQVMAAAPEIEGRKLERVEARGKNLLFHFEGGRVLHSHMRMTGSWHIYRPGEAWQKSQRAARVVLETADMIAVCFSAPVVEVLTEEALPRHPSLARLGPDILKEGFDPAVARARLRQRADAPISEALLMQGALAGIGNVYKSEVLFLCRIDPFVAVSALSDAVLDRVIRLAQELMSRNLEGYARTTTRAVPRAFMPARGPRYHVYGRAGEACPECGTKVRANRAASGPVVSGEGWGAAAGGEATRVTFFCPQCQPPGALGEAPA